MSPDQRDYYETLSKRILPPFRIFLEASWSPRLPYFHIFSIFPSYLPQAGGAGRPALNPLAGLCLNSQEALARCDVVKQSLSLSRVPFLSSQKATATCDAIKQSLNFQRASFLSSQTAPAGAGHSQAELKFPKGVIFELTKGPCGSWAQSNRAYISQGGHF